MEHQNNTELEEYAELANEIQKNSKHSISGRIICAIIWFAVVFFIMYKMHSCAISCVLVPGFLFIIAGLIDAKAELDSSNPFSFMAYQKCSIKKKIIISILWICSYASFVPSAYSMLADGDKQEAIQLLLFPLIAVLIYLFFIFLGRGFKWLTKHFSPEQIIVGYIGFFFAIGTIAACVTLFNEYFNDI